MTNCGLPNKRVKLPGAIVRMEAIGYARAGTN